MFAAKQMAGERSRPSRRSERHWDIRGRGGYVRIAELGTTGASLDKGIREANAGMEEPVILFPVLWWENGAGRWIETWTSEIKLDPGLKILQCRRIDVELPLQNQTVRGNRG